jgi:hypothetical protein
LTKRDAWALRNGTRRAKPKDYPRTTEEKAWPTEARILALMGAGFSYAEAWGMSPRDAKRYSAISAAWAIPPDERVGQVRRGKAGQSIFG